MNQDREEKLNWLKNLPLAICENSPTRFSRQCDGCGEVLWIETPIKERAAEDEQTIWDWVARHFKHRLSNA